MKEGIRQRLALAWARFRRCALGRVRSANRAFGRALDDLARLIDLRVISDIHYDAAQGLLRFSEAGRPYQLILHPEDRATLGGAIGSEEVVAEFRVEGGSPREWLMLSAKGRVAGSSYAEGLLFRMMTPRFARDLLTHRARLLDLGHMASALNHELKQSFAVIALAAENGAQQLRSPTGDGPALAIAKFEKIREQVARAKRLMARISHYSGKSRECAEVLDIAEVVAGTAELVAPTLKHDVVMEIADQTLHGARVRMSQLDLEQVLVNLVQNAADAIREARQAGQETTGRIGVTFEIVQNSGRPEVLISIRDDGVGLCESQRERLFNLFYTSKPPGEGSGLGLYICRQLVEEAGGRVSLEPNSDGGATARICLPSVSEL